MVAYQKGNSFQDHVSSERGVFYGIAEADLSPDTTFAIGASNQNDNRNDNWVGLPSPLGGRHLTSSARPITAPTGPTGIPTPPTCSAT